MLLYKIKTMGQAGPISYFKAIPAAESSISFYVSWVDCV